MHRAGYDLSGTIKALEHQRHADGEAAKRTIVQKRAEGGEYDKIVTDHVAQQGFAGFFTGMSTAVTQGVVNSLQDFDRALAQRHQMTELRQKGIQAYIARQYAQRERRAPDTERFRATIANGGMIAYLKQHQLAFEASRHLANGDIAKAESLARQSIRAPAEHAAATRYAMYRVLAHKGDFEEAYRQLQAIRNIEAAPGVILMNYAIELDRRGRHQEAVRYARMGAAKTGINAGAGHSAEAKQKAEMDKAFKAYFGFGEDGLCDRVNETTQNLVMGLGGQKVAASGQANVGSQEGDAGHQEIY
jgi:tetratricopeptide (TPR) repeat protein